MGCVIHHQSNAVNIPHQTNAGLIYMYSTLNYIHDPTVHGGRWGTWN